MSKLQALFDRLPPHDLDSEMIYLGICMTDLLWYDRTVHMIESPEAFYSENNRAVFRAIAKCSETMTQADLTTLDQFCRKIDPDYGGRDYLLRCAESGSHLVSADYHAKIIAKHYRARRLIDAAGDAVHRVYCSDDEPEQVIDSLSDRLSQLSVHSDGGQIVEAKDVAAKIARKIKLNEPDRFVPTGFRTLDAWLRGGVRPGEVMVIGGRPGQGKTALGVNMLDNAASAGHKVAFVTIEMDPEGIVRRLMGPSIYANNREAAYSNALAQVERLNGKDIPIVNLASGSLGEMRRHVRSLVRTRQIEGVFVDYLQLVSVDGVTKDYERVSHVSTSIKRMAREFGLAVWSLAQINRDGGKKERPTMSDLKGSGSIEQDADQIVLIHNPVAYDDFEDPPELIVAKHRNGRTGSVVVDYIPEETRFVEVA